MPSRTCSGRKFCEGVLGLKPTSVTDLPEGQWVEYEFGSYALAIGKSPGWKPSPDSCTAALEVKDFDTASAHLKRHGVKFRMEPPPTPGCRMV